MAREPGQHRTGAVWSWGKKEQGNLEVRTGAIWNWGKKARATLRWVKKTRAT